MGLDNHQVVLAERPKDEIIPGTTFNHKIVPAPTEADLKDGDLLVEVLYLSLDPAMRGWLNSMSLFSSTSVSRASAPIFFFLKKTLRTNNHPPLF